MTPPPLRSLLAAAALEREAGQQAAAWPLPPASLCMPGASATAAAPGRPRPASPEPAVTPKRARRNEADPSPPPLAAEARFAALLAQGQAAQPQAAQAAWLQAVQGFCQAGRHGGVDGSLLLLQRTLALPTAAQRPLTEGALHFLGRKAKPELRAEVLLNLAEIHASSGLAATETLCAAAQAAPNAGLARELLQAVCRHVPKAHCSLFLTAAEVLLEGGDADDLGCVVAAAKACSLPLRSGEDTFVPPQGRRPARLPQALPPNFTEAEYLQLDQAMFGGDFGGDNEYADGEDLCGAAWLGAPDALGDASARPYWFARRENVQDCDRLRAVKASWAHLGRLYPRVLPTEALWRLVDGAEKALCRRAQQGEGSFAADVLGRMEKSFPHAVATVEEERRVLAQVRPEPQTRGYQILDWVWRGEGGGGLMASIVENDDLSAHLGEDGVRARAFVAQLWRVVHAERGEVVGGASARRERDNLRHAFWCAVMDNAVLQVRSSQQLPGEPPAYRLSRRRLCGNGLAQRLLNSLAGYEPISLDRVTPQQLLVQLSRAFAQPFGETAEPTASELACFVLAAKATARDALDADQLETFAVHLQDYVLGDYGAEAEAALALVAVDEARAKDEAAARA